MTNNSRTDLVADLVADIGATNARFQLCTAQGLQAEPVLLATADYQSVSDLLAAVRGQLGGEVGRALFAVAGPADVDGNITVTNTGLCFHKAECAALLGCPVVLVNDFFALAHGVPYFTALQQLGGAAPLPGNKALLGPGSGLGMATLVTEQITEQVSEHGSKAAWRVLASEGGHADLAPGSPLEVELLQLLSQQHGHVSWETVLCGNGLQNLYRAMCGVWGSAPENISAAEISQRGAHMQDPVCHQALECFCGLLGSAAGNLALMVTAVGGVYIGGGIVPQMLDFVHTSPLRRRFEERGSMTDYVRQIPIYLISDHHPGLVAARHCLYAQQGTLPPN